MLEEEEEAQEEEEAKEGSNDSQISILLPLEALIGFWFLRGSQELGHICITSSVESKGTLSKQEVEVHKPVSILP